MDFKSFNFDNKTLEIYYFIDKYNVWFGLSEILHAIQYDDNVHHGNDHHKDIKDNNNSNDNNGNDIQINEQFKKTYSELLNIYNMNNLSILIDKDDNFDDIECCLSFNDDNIEDIEPLNYGELENKIFINHDGLCELTIKFTTLTSNTTTAITKNRNFFNWFIKNVFPIIDGLCDRSE